MNNKKKISRKTACYLLMIIGSKSNITYASQTQSEELTNFIPILIELRNQRILNDIHGDNLYLKSVRDGKVHLVKPCLVYLARQQPPLDFNTQNNDGDTDLMLAIRGGQKEEFGENYNEIFNLLIQKTNRNVNIQNNKGQTALLLAVGWGRFECFQKLLQIPGLNPNISNIDGSTPLLASIATRQIEIAQTLILDPRVNVNQRGPDQKLPLQIMFEAGIASQLVNIFCRRVLGDYDSEVKNMMQEMLQILPNMYPHGCLEDILKINRLLTDQKVNVTDYFQCNIDDLINAIRRKIYFLLNKLNVDLSTFNWKEHLQQLDLKTLLFDNFLSKNNKNGNAKDDTERRYDLMRLFAFL